MRPIIGRLLRTSGSEIRFRVAQRVRIGLERINVACNREAWRRERLPSVLTPGPAEISAALDAASRKDWWRAHESLRRHFLEHSARFVLNPAERLALTNTIRDRFPMAVAESIGRGQPLLEHRFDLLGYRGLSFQSANTDIDWHLDPVHARSAPLKFWSRVPYLDPETGDHKIIWELNRHQHWLRLGRAAWLTGDPRYQAAFRGELESWLAGNPPLVGINWASMLELALRSISWIWALHLFVADDEGGHQQPWLVDLIVGLDRQLEQVSRHLSTYFSPNTHLLGEGLALYVAGRALPELQSARRWEAIGRAVLLRAASAQIHADGGHAELSCHYHRYALDFYLLALAIARKTGDPDEMRFAEVVTRLASFCRSLADSNGRLAMIGDDDGGLLFPICGREPSDARDSLALAAALLGRPELAVGKPPEEVVWMLGAAAGLPSETAAPAALESRAFPDSGYVVLRSARAHAILDAGRHGFMNGGHAHADALSLVLSVDGHQLLIDPGTASYTDSELRDRFRSTSMHNTVVVEGRPQSIPAGPFHWSTRAHARLRCFRYAADFDYAEARHDGYGPLIHARAVLRTPQGLWLIADHLLGAEHHTIDAHWHLHPSWTAQRSTTSMTEYAHPAGAWARIASTAGNLQELRGEPNGIGWYSPVYGQVVPSSTLRATHTAVMPSSIVTCIDASASSAPLELIPATVLADREDGWHRIAATISQPTVSHLVLFATPATVTDEPAAPRRGLQRVAADEGELVTDARAIVLELAADGSPCSLLIIDGCVVLWTGQGAFDLTLGAAQDLHLDCSALARLSRHSGGKMAEARPVG
jgi:uncharacterized heparinase superfamily protein